jgi:two-component system response regulator HydG
VTAAEKARVLLVEDDPSSRAATRLLLDENGYEVIAVGDGRAALARLREGVAVIITDLRMPNVDGLQLLRTTRQQSPHIPVLVITGHGSEEVAVEALKAGAFHYLTKPLKPDEFLHHVRQAIEKHRMAAELASLHHQLNDRAGFCGMVGKSEPMRRVFEQIQMVAGTKSTVLIQGESGTGKELVARALHVNSDRREKHLVAVNCAALPKSLMESELFGHAKGAFTGATEKRVGKFIAADGGTLLIDEVSEMPLELQSKLLRVLENRMVVPLGSNQEIESDVRIIAATNRNLREMVDEGEFREDLFYRLHVVCIDLPPLRDRRVDIPLLVNTFIKEISSSNERPVREITAEAMIRLQSYDWPGNVRELRNMLESIIVMSTRELIDVSDLVPPVREADSSLPIQSLIDRGMPLAEIEKEVIRQTLQRTGGNRTEASRILGISTRTLQRRLKEFGWEV